MKTYISMLRGINVAGQKKIKMEDLRALYEALEYRNVQSYVQSGNVVFDSDEADVAVLASQIEAGIERNLGYSVSVFIRDANDFRRIVDGNPFVADENVDLKRLYVTFLYRPAAQTALDALAVPPGCSDEFALAGDAVYLYCPDGYGTSKLSNTFFERKLAVPATTRNWNTVTALLAMAASE